MSGLRLKTALLLLLLATPSIGQSPLSFRSFILRFGGPASLPVLADADGDGWTDLTVGWGGPDASPGTLAFFRNRNGVFSSIPDQSLRLPADAILFDLTHSTGDDGSSVWILTPPGVRVVRFPDPSGAPADTAFPIRTAFPGTMVDRPAAWPFASTLPGPEAPVLLIPAADGLRPFNPLCPGSADSLAVRTGFRIFRSAVRSGSPTLSFTLPVLIPCEWDGDGIGDAAVVLDGEVALLLRRDASVRSDASPAFAAGWGGDPASRQRNRDFEFRDFNGDGLTDALVIEAPAPGLLTPPGWARLHLNRKDGWDPSPDQVLVLNRFFGDKSIADFNGDGRPDLCLVSLESGPADIIRYGLTRRVMNRFDFHFCPPDGRFGSKPDRSVTLAFSRTLSALFSEPLVGRPFSGDFDGDGRDDIGVWVSEDELRLIPAGPKGPMDVRRTVRLRFPRTDFVRTADLNRDGKSDLVLSYPDGSPEPSCILLISGGRDE
jgi:hypothetical protein